MRSTTRSRDGIMPEACGFDVLADGRLAVQHLPLSDLAAGFGTPLHVLDIDRLRSAAATAARALDALYPGRSRVHYAMKANSTPDVARIVASEGLGVEVMTPYELRLALESGFASDDIVVNGPCKTIEFLRACLEAEVKAIVVDSLSELERIDRLARESRLPVGVLLRVNPDAVPHGMNRGSAMASRRGSPFGLDLAAGEVGQALECCAASAGVILLGYHMHIGTGLRRADDHARAVRRIGALLRGTLDAGHRIEMLDLGGGFGIPTSRGFTTMEMLRYQATGRLPRFTSAGGPQLRDFVIESVGAVREAFHGHRLPELMIEPGRALVGGAGCLVLTVEYIKHRPGVGTWCIADGGLGTVSMPTWYEAHEVFVCNRPRAPRTEIVNVVGPGCFAGDVIYRNMPMPEIREGEPIVLADTGAYFLALESNFSHPRPAILGIEGGVPRVLRRRESYADMVARDTTIDIGVLS